MLPPQIFKRARVANQGLLAHTPNGDEGPQMGTRVPQKNFNLENLKFGLKFSVWATITSGLAGVSSRKNFFQSTCRRVGVIMWVPFSEGPPLKFGRAKNVQNSARFLTTFDFDRDYLRNVSSRRSRGKNHQLQPLPRWTKKIGELWSSNNRVIVAHIDQRKWTFFGRLHFGH